MRAVSVMVLSILAVAGCSRHEAHNATGAREVLNRLLDGDPAILHERVYPYSTTDYNKYETAYETARSAVLESIRNPNAPTVSPATSEAWIADLCACIPVEQRERIVHLSIREFLDLQADIPVDFGCGSSLIQEPNGLVLRISPAVKAILGRNEDQAYLIPPCLSGVSDLRPGAHGGTTDAAPTAPSSGSGSATTGSGKTFDPDGVGGG